MNVLDPLPRADFLALIKCDPAAFRDHRHHGQLLLWHEAGKAPKSQNRELRTCTHDAILLHGAWFRKVHHGRA
jgi:hypothetical protein